MTIESFSQNYSTAARRQPESAIHVYILLNLVLLNLVAVCDNVEVVELQYCNIGRKFVMVIMSG